MKTIEVKFERDDNYLILYVDGKISKRWKLENLPKDDSFNSSPDRAFVDMVHQQSRLGNAIIVVE